MKYKAKRLDNGEWVEGYYYNDFGDHYIYYPDIDVMVDIEIDPSTLCQQVRGTELFEGDEVELSSRDEYAKLGYISWNDYHKSFMVKVDSIHQRLDNYWKTTGKNKYDEKANGDN